MKNTVESLDLGVRLLESSRSKLGVRLILRVSRLSSLKNESVFRTLPFLDLLMPTSSDSEVSMRFYSTLSKHT